MAKHTHTHGDTEPQAHDDRTSSRKSLWIAFALISAYMAVEVVGGFMANSLALLADAGHMVTDAAAIGLALFAMWMATRPASARRTFGYYRTEIIAALANALSLWIIAAWIFYEAYLRFTSPPTVQGPLLLTVGTVGLFINIAAALILMRSSKESLNVEGAFLHVLGDLLGSIGVVAAGILIIAFGWYIVDPIFGVLIGLLVLFSASRLLWKVVHVLMQGTPSQLDLDKLCTRLEQVEGVAGVHDIHAWSMTTGYDVLSAHVTANSSDVTLSDHLLQHLREIASREFGVAHVTIQLEDGEQAQECEERHHTAHI